MRLLATIIEPFILSLLATVVLASLLPPRGVWMEISNVATDGAIVLLFFLHGAKLSRHAILGAATHWRLHLATLATTFIIFPLIGLLIFHSGVIGGPLATGVLFLSLLPSTVQSSIAFTAMARGNVAAAVCGASFSNLVGLFATPLLVTLLIAPVQSTGSHGQVAQTIALQLLLPFLVGHACRPLLADLVVRYKKLVGLVDRGSILLVVYTAFGAAVLEGLWNEVSLRDLLAIAAVCAVQLALVLMITTLLGRWLGFASEDRVVLLFAGSKKSLASGVPMAGVLFPAAGIGMIVLPLMMFHQLQLIVCAMIARSLGDRADQLAETAVDATHAGASPST